MTRKALHIFGSVLFAAATVAACAGDGGDSDNSGTGNTSGGGNNSGTGNTSGGGTGGTSGSGSGGSGSTNTGSALTTVGGYHVAGPLNGYFWTAADMGGSTVLPKDFSVNGKICAKGTAAKVEGEAYATTWGTLLGYNVNQKDMPPNDPGTKGLTGTVTIGLSGTVPDGTRLKVAVGTTDYCTTLTSGSNTVPLSTLKKECWTAGGEAYAGQPVAAMAIQVSTNPTTATNFDFCVTSLTYSE